MRGMDMRDQACQRVLGAERGEVGDLRLEAAHVWRSGIDDRAAEVEHRVPVGGELRRKLRRLRIEPDADQRVGLSPARA
jgi:hypothetical protein